MPYDRVTALRVLVWFGAMQYWCGVMRFAVAWCGGVFGNASPPRLTTGAVRYVINCAHERNIEQLVGVLVAHSMINLSV